MTKTARDIIMILLGLSVLVATAIFLSGCGLHYVPSGMTPSAGSQSLGGAILDGAAKADAAGWGDLAQIIGGALGVGGIVTVGRNVLKGHRERKAKATRNDMALIEIVAGIQDAINDGKIDLSDLKPILFNRQSPETRKLVAAIKVDYAENRDSYPTD